ncbi:hypothetical protein [Methanobacterium oryzae]|uniref:hypothetical protein n=1 Tax=Methanobacterium oryzae TaxID=69540 RepID=UPI003D211C22
MSKKSEVANDNSINLSSKIELNKELVANIEDYSKAARNIINRLEDRRRVNEGFLSEIDLFIEYAKKQVKNNDLSKDIRLRYLDLIEEEESLRYRIKKDLNRNNELIESIKKSTNALFR